MKKRPLVLTILALIHFLYPVYYTFQVMYFEHIPAKYLFPLIKILFNPFQEFPFFFLSVSAIILGYGLFKVRAWAYWFFILYAIYTVILNIYSFTSLGEDDPIPPFFRLAAVLTTFFFMFYFVRKHIRAPYFNPRLRWWESAPRYKVEDMHIKIKNLDDDTIADGEIYDMSVGGVFVASKYEPALGSRLSVSFQLLGQISIDCIGSVVWISPGNDKHPGGFGIMFTEILKNDKRQIKSYLKSLSKELLR